MRVQILMDKNRETPLQQLKLQKKEKMEREGTHL